MCLHCIGTYQIVPSKAVVGVDHPCMAYISISIKPYIKSHLELQTEITLIELAPGPYFFV